MGTGIRLFMYWENRIYVLGLGFNQWERHKPFLKGKWDFYYMTQLLKCAHAPGGMSTFRLYVRALFGTFFRKVFLE